MAKHGSCKSKSQVKTPEVTHTLDARLSARLSERHEEFERLYSSVRKKLRPGAVHDLRSSSRRLIAALDFFEPLETPIKTARARRELKELLHALGELRNLQVGQKRVKSESSSKDSEEFLRILKKQERHEKKTARRAIQAFRSKFVRKQVAELCQFLEQAPAVEPDFEANLRELCSEHLRELYHRITEAVQAVPKKNPPPAPIHEVRIRFKQFRYAWEFVSPSLRESKTTHQALREFQNFLGGIQDLHVLLGLLVQASPGKLNPYARTLARKQRAMIGKFHTVYPPILSKFRAPLSHGVRPNGAAR